MKAKLIALVIAFQSMLFVKGQDVGTVIGYTKTVYNTVNWVLGSADVTPAYALGAWRLDAFGDYGTEAFANRWRISRSPLTGLYFFTFFTSSSSGGTYTDHNPFNVVSSPARRNYFCDMSSVDPNTGVVIPRTYHVLQDFIVHVWMAGPPVLSGPFPPTEPYAVWLRSDASKLPNSCAPVAPPVGGPVRNGGNLNLSGTIGIKFGMVDYEYAWPPLCWVGGMWDYN